LSKSLRVQGLLHKYERQEYARLTTAKMEGTF
jgi:hypothetical protein